MKVEWDARDRWRGAKGAGAARRAEAGWRQDPSADPAVRSERGAPMGTTKQETEPRESDIAANAANREAIVGVILVVGLEKSPFC